MLESFQERSFRFGLEILKFYRRLTETDVPPWLASQMLRAGTAIGANLAEAKSASSRRDLIHRNAIALREGRECLFWLQLIAADQPQLTPNTTPLITECNELVSVLTKAIRALRTPRS